MTEHSYVYWLWVVLIINTLPHLIDAGICFFWQDMVQRKRLRLFFAFASTLFLTLFFVRMVTLTGFDTSFGLLLGISIAHTFMSYFKSSVLAVATLAIRTRGQTADTEQPSKMLTPIIEEMRGLVKPS